MLESINGEPEYIVCAVVTALTNNKNLIICLIRNDDPTDCFRNSDNSIIGVSETL